MRLDIGKSITVNIKAKTYWNDTGLVVNAGEEYAFETKGFWKDWFIQADAEGYTSFYMRFFDKSKRARCYKWFALVGSLDKKSYFLIGQKSRIVCPKSGVLNCFANDTKRFYWNNCGALELRIERIR